MKKYTESQWLAWIDRLAIDDYVVIDNFFPKEDYNKIKLYFNLKESDFEKAGIGAINNVVASEIRSDFTYWIDRKKDPAMASWFEYIEEIKAKLNRYCYLSLSGDEFHFAHYPKGSFYKKHLDQFKKRNNRLITVLLYLNDHWEPQDEGQLVVYKDEDQLKINPLGNRLVLFKSDTLYHEVLPTKNGRKSLTGWLLYEPKGLSFLGT
ncbi:MAG: 2OG-Fe(II) oxygenase [Weeksellaceae bacterium]